MILWAKEVEVNIFSVSWLFASASVRTVATLYGHTPVANFFLEGFSKRLKYPSLAPIKILLPAQNPLGFAAYPPASNDPAALGPAIS